MDDLNIISQLPEYFIQLLASHSKISVVLDLKTINTEEKKTIIHTIYYC